MVRLSHFHTQSIPRLCSTHRETYHELAGNARIAPEQVDYDKSTAAHQLDFARMSLAEYGSQCAARTAQARTAIPTIMRYTANGANPRFRTQCINHATTA